MTLQKSKIVSVLCFFLIFLYPQKTEYGFLTSHLEDLLEDTLGFPVGIQRFQTQGFNRFSLHGVRIYEATEKKLIVEVKKIEIDYELTDLLARKIKKITLTHPFLDFDIKTLRKIQSQFNPKKALKEVENKFSISQKEIRSVKKNFSIDRIEIEKGTLNYHQEERSFLAKDLNLHVDSLTQKGFSNFDFFVQFVTDRKKTKIASVKYQAHDLDIDKNKISLSRMTIKNLDLAMVSDFIHPFLPQAWGDSKVRGQLNLDVNYTNETSPGTSTVKSSWSVNQIEMDALKGDFALAGFSGNGTVESQIHNNQNQLDMVFETNGRMGQLLYGTFYQDFQETPIQVMGHFSYLRKEDLFQIKKFKTKLNQSNFMNVNGFISKIMSKEPDFEMNTDLGPIEINQIYKNGLLDGLMSFYPSWTGISSLEGLLKAKMKTKGSLKTKNLNAQIFLDLENLNLENPEKKLDIDGFSTHLPLHIRKNKSLKISSLQPLSISWKRFKNHPWTLGGVEVTGELHNNTFELKNPVDIEVYQGKITIPELRISNILKPTDGLQTSLKIKDIQLRPFSEEMNLYPVEGKVNADFSQVEIEADQLKTMGHVLINAFMGEIFADQIWASDLSLTNRKTGLSFRFKDMNLGQLSQLTTFGYIWGVMKGEVKDLVIYGGQPIAFEMDVDSVHYSGVSRKVGIEAVRNIAIFAGASSILKFLDQGIYQFIDTYNYEAFGIGARLKDGSLHLNAKLRDDEKKLFLKGRGLPRIDIVYNEGGGEVLFDSILKQYESIQLRLREEKEK